MKRNTIIFITLASLTASMLGGCKKKTEVVPEQMVNNDAAAEEKQEITEDEAAKLYKDTLADLKFDLSDNYYITLEKQNGGNETVEKIIFATCGDDYYMTWQKGFSDFEVCQLGNKKNCFLKGITNPDEEGGYVCSWFKLGAKSKFDRKYCLSTIKSLYNVDLSHFDTANAEYVGWSFSGNSIMDEFSMPVTADSIDSEVMYRIVIDGKESVVYQVDNNYYLSDVGGLVPFESDGTIKVGDAVYSYKDLTPYKVDKNKRVNLSFDRETKEIRKIEDESSGMKYIMEIGVADSINSPEDLSDNANIEKLEDKDVDDYLSTLGIMAQSEAEDAKEEEAPES